MPYSVIYSTKGIAKFKSQSRNKRIKRLLLIVSGAVICFALCYAPVRNQLIQIFFPGDHEVTKVAATQMIEDIREGKPVREAVTAFCQEILEHDLP